MVIRAYIFLILLIPALTVPNHPNYKLVNDPKCGLQAPRTRIFNGIEASPGEFPWMVAFKIERKTLNGSTIYNLCGGSILNENYVLTAAHCVVDNEISKVARLTMFLPDCTGRIRPTHSVKKIVANSNYKPDYVELHDIALVRVDKPISFNEHVGPVCLEYGDLLGKTYVGESAQVTGFGTYKFENNDWNKPMCTSKLQKLTVPIQNDQDCFENIKLFEEDKYWNSIKAAIKSLICVHTVVGGKHQFAHKGDSGSPLVIAKQVNSDTRPRYYQIGLVSFGALANETVLLGYTSVYTRVSFYLKWILDNLEPGENEPEETQPGGKRPRH